MKANSLGLVLETLRIAEGMTQAQLAVMAGVTQAALSRYENGLREPDAAALTALAAALGVTSQFLHSASRPRGAVAVEAHMRRRRSAKASDWHRAGARLNVHRMHAREVLEQIALHAEQRVPSFEPCDTEAATAAIFLRMQWRMPSGPVRGIVQWVESAGCLVLEEDFGATGIDGLSQWVDELPIMLLNSSAPTDRKRWTIAHELGHLCLHSVDVPEELEEQANEFAGEFLMPSEFIRPQLRNLTLGRLLDLKREWQVSMQALIEKAYSLDQLSSVQRTNLYKSLSKRGWRTAEPLSEQLRAEVPSVPEQIGAALTESGLTREEVATVLGYAAPRVGVPFVPTARLRAL